MTAAAELRLEYLPVNQAFAFVFGDTPIDIDGKYLFTGRLEAIAAAESKGLAVDDDGRVHTPEAVGV